jgi:hypothetical protein
MLRPTPNLSLPVRHGNFETLPRFPQKSNLLSNKIVILFFFLLTHLAILDDHTLMIKRHLLNRTMVLISRKQSRTLGLPYLSSLTHR